jgi:hypothetical protein
LGGGGQRGWGQGAVLINDPNNVCTCE